LQPQGVNIAIVFNGFYCLLIGYLIFRSAFLPRILGALMGFAGLGWLTFLSTPLANHLSPYNLASGLLGEGSVNAHSPFADPQFLNISSTPPNLDVLSSSPAVNAGTNLGSSVVGLLDYAGNPRLNANGQINIGAYEK
jgi:hypothetical protein